ncbi:MAG: hypothetical protein ABWX84_02025 [Nocardioides sp.]
MIPRWTPGQWLLRVVIVLTPLGAVLAGIPAGATPGAYFLLVLLVLAVLFALFPASTAGVLVLLMPVVWWAAAPDDPLHPMSMVAAVALLACHVAAVLASYGPDRLPLDPALVRLWVRRALLVLVPVPVLWAAADVLTGERERPAVWVAGLAVAGVAAVLSTTVFGERPQQLRESFVQLG